MGKFNRNAVLSIILFIGILYFILHNKFLNPVVSQCVLVNSTMNCRRYFLNYTPSQWEEMWYKNINEYQNNVCERLSNNENLNKTIQMMQRMIELQRFGRNKTNSELQTSDNLFSRMFYREECQSPHPNISLKSVDASYLIEPLIGLLRDPFSICSRINSSSIPNAMYEGAVVQSKRFILLSIAAPSFIDSSSNQFKNFPNSQNNKNSNAFPWIYLRTTDIEHPKVILFDLGSSYFGAWGGDMTAASSLWLYAYYKRFNVKFDRIIAFEYSSLDPKNAWNQLPDDVFPIYTLINVGVASDGKFNPWTMLETIAQPQDHVIVKLDIDTPILENALINQLLNDSKIHSLVDELCFEHHITVNEMIPYWQRPGGSLKDSYTLFRKIRELGIRMHSWP
ncbi:hypothetical protein I4U23_004364 [Adineta vaga]|nr:hypothetical protein I4U23_004364 [Adineta vaga]